MTGRGPGPAPTPDLRSDWPVRLTYVPSCPSLLDVVSGADGGGGGGTRVPSVAVCVIERRDVVYGVSRVCAVFVTRRAAAFMYGDEWVAFPSGGPPEDDEDEMRRRGAIGGESEPAACDCERALNAPTWTETHGRTFQGCIMYARWEE
jgi:hypothetical protein